jgi:RNA polymerase primary sigma factor
MIGAIHRLVRASQKIRQETGRAPGADALGRRLDMDAAEVREALKIAKGLVSLEAPLGGEPGEEPGGEAADPAPDAPEGLTPHEERVLCMRFDIAMEADPALERLGQQLLESRERLRKAEAKARHSLKPEDPEAS